MHAQNEMQVMIRSPCIESCRSLNLQRGRPTHHQGAWKLSQGWRGSPGMFVLCTMSTQWGWPAAVCHVDVHEHVCPFHTWCSLAEVVAPNETPKRRKLSGKVEVFEEGQGGLPERLGNSPLRMIIVGTNPSGHAWYAFHALLHTVKRSKLCVAKNT